MFCCGHFNHVSFPRVTAFAPQDQAKELVTLRKPTVYKVTSMMTVQIGSAPHLYTVHLQTVSSQNLSADLPENLINCRTHIVIT